MSQLPAARAYSRTVLVLLALLWLAGSLRAFALWAHDPLYAYANSYDEVRYTNCFHFYPDRPSAIPAEENSPNAPFAKFRFITNANPMCYWSSELLFTGGTALAWKLDELRGGGRVHEVRWIGALRWIALLALSIGFSFAWLRRGDARAALANAALVPLLFADPGNALYLDTFYAEWSALLGAYALIALSLLWRDEVASRRRFCTLALVAFALALAKIQHLMLPLCLALVVMVLERLRHARFGWRGGALALGALAGLTLQAVQLGRDNGMMDSIHQYNRADVVFTALLPFAHDREALLTELGINPACAVYSGLHAWELPDLPERVCSGLESFTRGKEFTALLRHPGMTLRLAGHGVLGLDPWIAKNLGEVEGASVATIPPSVPGIGPLLHAYPIMQLAILALPMFALFLFLCWPGVRRGSRGLDYAALSVALMCATLAITVLGDGLADTAKQGHLVINAALAWLIVGVFMAPRLRLSAG
ncbi:MAG: hypothetical protein ABIQ70_13060 [Dokdonella sp.]